MKAIGFDKARAELRAILDQAQSEPVCITRHGKPVAVVTGVEGQELEVVLSAPAKAPRKRTRAA